MSSAFSACQLSASAEWTWLPDVVQAAAGDEENASQQSALGGLFSLWTFYNSGTAEQIVRRRDPQPDSSEDGFPLEVRNGRTQPCDHEAKYMSLIVLFACLSRPAIACHRIEGSARVVCHPDDAASGNGVLLELIAGTGSLNTADCTCRILRMRAHGGASSTWERTRSRGMCRGAPRKPLAERRCGPRPSWARPSFWRRRCSSSSAARCGAELNRMRAHEIYLLQEGMRRRQSCHVFP